MQKYVVWFLKFSELLFSVSECKRHTLIFHWKGENTFCRQHSSLIWSLTLSSTFRPFAPNTKPGQFIFENLNYLVYYTRKNLFSIFKRGKFFFWLKTITLWSKHWRCPKVQNISTAHLSYDLQYKVLAVICSAYFNVSDHFFYPHLPPLKKD